MLVTARNHCRYHGIKTIQAIKNTLGIAMKIFNIFLLLILGFCLTLHSAQAQNNTTKFAIGPQISTLGLGISSTLKFNSIASISADISFLPMRNRIEEIDGITYDIDPSIAGIVLMGNIYPGKGNFSFGIGAMFGGYDLSGLSENIDEDISIGSNTYS